MYRMGPLLLDVPLNFTKKGDSMIPFMNLTRQYGTIKSEVTEAISVVLENAEFIGGPHVQEFEISFAAYLGAKRVVTVSNGTDALFLAYRALGLGPGDDVVVPSTTFIATASAVVRTGANVIFADCDPDTWEVDPKSVRDVMTDNTKALVGVHLYGQPFDVSNMISIARDEGCRLVEDCAQAHGATFNGRKVGTFGDASAFSFYPGKNLGAYGDAGAVVTNDDIVADQVVSLRDHGSVVKYRHDELGYNMRMDGIQAAVLNVKLKHLDAWTARRREIADEYQRSINNPSVKLQKSYNGSRSVYHLFVVEVEDRDRFLDYMKEGGVACGIHYPVACHKQPAFSQFNDDDFPNAVSHASSCVSLPMFPELTAEEIDKVVDLVNGY